MLALEKRVDAIAVKRRFICVLTKIPAEKELRTPIEMSSAAPLWEKTVRTPIPIAIPL
jgi:hypothetical protein